MYVFLSRRIILLMNVVMQLCERHRKPPGAALGVLNIHVYLRRAGNVQIIDEMDTKMKKNLRFCLKSRSSAERIIFKCSGSQGTSRTHSLNELIIHRSPLGKKRPIEADLNSRASTCMTKLDFSQSSTRRDFCIILWMTVASDSPVFCNV